MTNQYYDFDSERVISLRLQDFDQYPDTTAGKVIRNPSPTKDKARQGGEFTQANTSRKNKTSDRTGKPRTK